MDDTTLSTSNRPTDTYCVEVINRTVDLCKEIQKEVKEINAGTKTQKVGLYQHVTVRVQKLKNNCQNNCKSKFLRGHGFLNQLYHMVLRRYQIG